MNEPEKVKKEKKKFAAGDKKSDAPPRELVDACRGLVFISETDADIEPFVCGETRSRSLRSYLDALQVDGKAVEEVPFANFFDRLTTEKDWHRALDKKRTRQFSKLRNVLEESLEDLRVIRVGRIRIDIYVAGVDSKGRLTGVKTTAIET